MFDRRSGRLISILFAVVALAATTLLSPAAFAHDATAVAAQPSPGLAELEAKVSRPATDIAALEEKWGIEIVALRRSAAGHLLDFRYRVVDAEKAAPISDRRYNPYMIDHARKLLMRVPSLPMVGKLWARGAYPKVGRVYFVMFGNPGAAVQPGDPVTIVIGDFRIDHFIVEG